MALLDQLFGIQPQQDTNGLVQNILAQRFQPSQEDFGHAAVQSVLGKMPSPYDVMQQRVKPGMDVAVNLSNINLQGQQAQAAELQNQMTQAQLQYMQSRMGNNGIQPPIGFQGQQSEGQLPQNSSLPPAGFNNNQNQSQGDPRYNQAINDAWMLDRTQVPKIELSQIENDPNVVGRKAEATKTGENAAANTLQATKADQLTQRLEMNLNAMLRLNPDVPSSGFIPATGHAYLSQATGANPWMGNIGIGDKGTSASAAHQWDQINNQQIISEIQQFIATGGANTRINQTLDRIVQAASGIDKDASPQAREKLILNALAEIHNKNISAGNIAGGNQPYQPIPVTGSNSQSNQPSEQPETKTINGQTFIKQNGTWYHQ